ncbi:MAG: extensin family protein [Phenylobacterium sp.]|nr:MAG: extensin family protein [Phenylobacterium sp.]
MANAWAPPQDLPWTPLRLDQPVGLATVWKYRHMRNDPVLCRQVLAEGGVALRDEPDRRAGRCMPFNSVRLEGPGLTPLKPAAPQMSCRLALGYALWDRHVLQPAAIGLLGGPVSEVAHLGTFACRNLYNEVDGRLSEHAYANAIDVAGFRTASGETVTVAKDFHADDPAGRFLRAVRDGGCHWFGAVLSPDYNLEHHDHLHFDEGRNHICR